MPRWGTQDAIRNTFFSFSPFRNGLRDQQKPTNMIQKETHAEMYSLGSCFMMLSASPPSNTAFAFAVFLHFCAKTITGINVQKQILNRIVFLHHRNNQTAQHSPCRHLGSNSGLNSRTQNGEKHETSCSR